MNVKVEVKMLESAKGLPLPSYQTKHAAGLDLVAAEELTLPPGARGAVGTGLTVAIPEGFELQVRPRSGLAIKHGITLINTPGTIDADYRGEIRILLINHGEEAFTIKRGERVAQALLAPVTHLVWEEVEELPATERGAGGFGSTGK
ncbi:MAG: dUTP diphosphatase [Deltaproteobacteria bacterium]|nr:MAG: dUTP diphosphatase [Deltaproteobacteria bacterium]